MARPRFETVSTSAAMLFVLWFFHWTVAANSGFDHWGDMDYYQLLVRGWQKGQLHLDKDPSPALLALKDPYDPEQNQAHKLGDATLYRGRYYLYFGAAPALTVMLPYAVLTGRQMTMGTATFIFASVAFLTAAGLWLALRRRYFPGSGAWIAPCGVLAIGFGTHLLALVQRPMIWELPISVGIAFTLLALAGVYRAIHGARPLWAMAAAGLCAGLAVGSRPTCLFACGLLLAPVWLAWRERRPERVWWRLGLAALGPLAACGLAIMAHNYARFDNPLEWGQNYQLSGAYEGKLVHFSPRFFLHNCAVYFFQPLRWTGEFPFALAEGIEISHIEDYFGTEEVCGLAVTFPFYWFVLALPLAWARRNGDEARRLTAVLGAIAVGVVPVMMLVLSYFSTTMRYQTDFSVALGVLALAGLLGLERWAGERRAGVAVLALGVAGVTVLVGTLVSFDYHGRSLRITAPGKWRELVRTTHAALAEVGHRLGQIEGPRVLKVRFKPQPMGTVETFWRATDPAAAERIVLEHIGERLIRFGHVRGADAPAWGRPLRWENNHTHTVAVQVPSLYPPGGHGAWDGVRREWSFRERTGVAVWFSGGRALDTVAAPLPRTIVPGGAVGADFLGEVRKLATRLYREDELPEGLVEPHAPRGGVLRMRVVVADDLAAEGEPIFAAGAHYRSNILFVQPAPGGVKLVFENYSQPRVESAVFRPAPAGHWLELELPSFRPDAFGVEATGEVVVRLDGREVLRTTQVGYHFPWGEEQIGRNPFGTTCGPVFRGWLREARWINASAPRT